MRIDYLNHASLLISFGPYKFLSDPWFEGEAFAGGWGLRYHNPDALALAATATHLWISHWHSDHLHAPTLAALAQRNPDIHVLANVSANFSMSERLASFGFRKITDLHERKPLVLEGGLRLVRYPTAGIDNALHMQFADFSILNYNDCNLPVGALQALRKSVGPVDLLLNNYNHAGKLFAREPIEVEKQALWKTLLRAVDLVAPKWVIPFASSHYYRVPASADQNRSLLTFDELAARSVGDSRFLVLRVGDHVELRDDKSAATIIARSPELQVQPALSHDYGASVAWDELAKAAAERCRMLRRGFPLVGHGLGKLRVKLEDLGRVMVLDIAHGGVDGGAEGGAHIECHSRALYEWLGRRFGDDSFFAGAHFGVRDPDTRVIERWALATLLEAGHLSLRDLLAYLASTQGRWFLWCRREEILSTVLRGKLKAAQIRLD